MIAVCCYAAAGPPSLPASSSSWSLLREAIELSRFSAGLSGPELIVPFCAPAAALPPFVFLAASSASDEDSSLLLEEILDPEASEAPPLELPELELDDELEEDELEEELLELSESYFISSSSIFVSSALCRCWPFFDFLTNLWRNLGR